MRALLAIIGLLASCTPQGAESGVSSDSFDSAQSTKTEVPTTLTEYLPGEWDCDWVCSLWGDRKDVAHTWRFSHDGVDGTVTSTLPERLEFVFQHGNLNECTTSVGVTDGWLRSDEALFTVEEAPWWGFGCSMMLIELSYTNSTAAYGMPFQLDIIDDDNLVMTSTPTSISSLIECTRSQGTE